jgi:glutathione peroxidase-family protein/uncharacterized membrane protein
MNVKTSILQNIARVLLGGIMTFAGIGHLTFQRAEFLAQVPRWLPSNEAFMDFVVLSSGVVEIALGLSMIFLWKHKVKAGLALALFYILIFPGNISQYTNEISAFGLDTDQKRFIRLFFQPVLILWALWSSGALKYLLNRKKQNTETPTTIYDFEANSLSGKKHDLSTYHGKTILIVNTASKCGLTPQYEGLENLYQKYKDKGLVILGFPCNQFGKQEKGTSEDIKEFCQINYGVTFPMFEKIEVNGKNAHPIFRFLKSSLPGTILGDRINWNFTKFVVDKNGIPAKRFAPTTKPEAMEKYIEQII